MSFLLSEKVGPEKSNLKFEKLWKRLGNFENMKQVWKGVFCVWNVFSVGCFFLNRGSKKPMNLRWVAGQIMPALELVPQGTSQGLSRMSLRESLQLEEFRR